MIRALLALLLVSSTYAFSPVSKRIVSSSVNMNAEGMSVSVPFLKKPKNTAGLIVYTILYTHKIYSKYYLHHDFLIFLKLFTSFFFFLFYYDREIKSSILWDFPITMILSNKNNQIIIITIIHIHLFESH